MRNKLKRIISITICLSLMLVLALGTVTVDAAGKQVKNVILLIPDGTSVDGTTLARWYNGGGPLALDEIASGLVRTYWAGGPITDSAPSGSAMATGVKTTNKYISVSPVETNMPGLDPIAPEDARRPLATVLEGAKSIGKATGLVATINIQHATPAAFSSHYPERDKFEILGEQQVYNNIDVVLAGGSKELQSANRADKEDLIQVIKDKGYEYITKADEMKNSTSTKLWGAFAPGAMDYDLDRNPEDQPSIAEMTEKAIEILSKDEDGFFLMVEGSKVDTAAHANEPIGLITEFLAFDRAAKVALDFAKKDGNTVVLAASDHGNGGISIGGSTTNKGYDSKPLSIFIEPLQKAKATGMNFGKKVNKNRSNIAEAAEEYYGISDLTQEELNAMKKPKANLNREIAKAVSKRANIDWTTTGHTGEDVVLYSYHPDINYRLTGVVQNTDIAKHIAEVLGFDLNELTKKLYVPAIPAFEEKGATVEIDKSDENNAVLVVTKGSDKLSIPVYKNIAVFNGETIELNGVVVSIDDKVYVSQQAIDLIK